MLGQHKHVCHVPGSAVRFRDTTPSGAQMEDTTVQDIKGLSNVPALR